MAVNIYKTSELSPVSQKLLEIVEAHRGEKLSRTDIAKALDKPRLNPHEILMLEELAKADKIDLDMIAQGKRNVILYTAKQN